MVFWYHSLCFDGLQCFEALQVWSPDSHWGFPALPRINRDHFLISFKSRKLDSCRLTEPYRVLQFDFLSVSEHVLAWQREFWISIIRLSTSQWDPLREIAHQASGTGKVSGGDELCWSFHPHSFDVSKMGGVSLGFWKNSKSQIQISPCGHVAPHRCHLGCVWFCPTCPLLFLLWSKPVSTSRVISRTVEEQENRCSYQET